MKFILIVISGFVLLACNSERSKFGGRWKVYSSQNKTDSIPRIETLDDFYIFRDEQFLRSGSEDPSEYWGSDSEKYEITDGNLSIYIRNTEVVGTQFAYEFIDKETLKLTYINPDVDGKALILKRIADK